jgi:hypothetical protein
MSKFANFGKAYAGVTPDMTSTISNMGVGLSNTIMQSANMRSKYISEFKLEEDAVNDAAEELTKKAEQMIDEIDDPELNKKFGETAKELQPKESSDFFGVGKYTEKEIEESATDLDRLDIVKNKIIKLKQTDLVDFESTASKHNVSKETYDQLLALANNNFDITKESLKNKSVVINGKEVDLNKVASYIEPIDNYMLTNVQSLVNQFISAKNESFSKQQFHLKLNTQLNKKGNAGAQIMVTEMALGETGSIKDQIINNFDLFAPLLGDKDLNSDGTPDAQQTNDPEVAKEVVMALTKIDHPNYNARTTNDFVRGFLTNQTETTFNANKAEADARNNNIDLNRDVFSQGNTGYFLKNLSGMIDLARQGKQEDVDRVGNQVGLELVKEGDKYVFLQRSSLKQEKGTGIQLTYPFDINNQDDIMKNVEVLAYQSLKSNLSANILQRYMAYGKNNKDLFYTPKPITPTRFKSGPIRFESDSSKKGKNVVANIVEQLPIKKFKTEF